jgi:hypothetical protein
MTALKVCDNISLFTYDAEIVYNGSYSTFSWDIPNSYYTDQRSQVCTVQLMDGILDLEVYGTVKGIAIMYENNGSSNNYTSKTPVAKTLTDPTKSSSNAPVLGVAERRASNLLKISQGIPYLCNARPQRIVLKFLDLTKKEVTEGSGLTGVFIFHIIMLWILHTDYKMKIQNICKASILPKFTAF